MRVRINRHHGAETVVRGNFGEHNGGAAFEAADLDDGAARGNAGGEIAKEASFVFKKEAGNVLRGKAGVLDNLFEVRRQRIQVRPFRERK